MWSLVLKAGEWIASSKVGQVVAAVAAAIVGVVVMRAKWRADGAREQRTEQQLQQAVETVQVMEKQNEAAAEYRADGPVERMRSGDF